MLIFLLGCLARGGMSLTATFAIYHRLWAATLEGTLYAQRPHFVSKLEVAVLVWAAVQLLEERQGEPVELEWFLRPHHAADDFMGLLQ